MIADYTEAEMREARTELIAEIVHAANVIARRGSNAGVDWREAAGSITCDYRALTTVERHLDAGNYRLEQAKPCAKNAAHNTQHNTEE